MFDRGNSVDGGPADLPDALDDAVDPLDVGLAQEPAMVVTGGRPPGPRLPSRTK
jgi:hypothetical protein